MFIQNDKYVFLFVFVGIGAERGVAVIPGGRLELQLLQGMRYAA